MGIRVNERDDWGVMAGVYDGTIIGGRLVSEGEKKENNVGQKPLSTELGGAGGSTSTSPKASTENDSRFEKRIDNTGKDNAPRFKADAEKFFGRMAGWAAQAINEDSEFWKQLGENYKGGHDSKAPWQQLAKAYYTKAPGQNGEPTSPESMIDTEKGDNVPGYNAEWLSSYLKETRKGQAGTVMVPVEVPGPPRDASTATSPSQNNIGADTGGIEAMDNEASEDGRKLDKDNFKNGVSRENDAQEEENIDVGNGDDMAYKPDGTQFASVPSEVNDQDPEVIAQLIRQNTIRVGKAWQDNVKGYRTDTNISDTNTPIHDHPKRTVGRNGSRLEQNQKSSSSTGHDRLSAAAIYAEIERKHREHVANAKLKLIELEEQLAEAEISRRRRSKAAVNEISRKCVLQLPFLTRCLDVLIAEEEEEEDDEQGRSSIVSSMRKSRGRKTSTGAGGGDLLRD